MNTHIASFGHCFGAHQVKGVVVDVLLLSHDPVDTAVPALGLLAHTVSTGAPDASSVSAAADADVVIVDARQEMAAARTLCRLLSGAVDAPVVALVSEGGLVAINAEWGICELLLPIVGPAELDARLRLLSARGGVPEEERTVLQLGELVIDEETYVARIKGKPLDLTYKEFELLKYLAGHVGRVFTREQLLQEVWGYDFFGGTRTVDVHVRRLRAKLGSDHEALIGTVRNVGYKAVRPSQRGEDSESE